MKLVIMWVLGTSRRIGEGGSFSPIYPSVVVVSRNMDRPGWQHGCGIWLRVVNIYFKKSSQSWSFMGLKLNSNC